MNSPPFILFKMDLDQLNNDFLSSNHQVIYSFPHFLYGDVKSNPFKNIQELVDKNGKDRIDYMLEISESRGEFPISYSQVNPET